MILFNCDYNEGAHPCILQKLVETNLEQTVGYGEDPYCAEAAELIRKKCQSPDADVHFLVGGTQTNLTVLAAALRPYQGVISADTGHIFVHETGAIEACGHKILAIPSDDGKLRADQVEALCRAHYEDDTHEHMVMPGALYISNPTEVGTIYSRKEVAELRAVCDRYRLTFFLDGARLGYGMAAPGNDLQYDFLARTVDAFYIGGTKQGALFGEALVLTQPEIQRNFRYLIKQKGGMLAKGRLLGIQFAELMRDGLYEETSGHAIAQAMRLRDAFVKKGFPAYVESPTNQQFFILPDQAIAALKENYGFSYIRRWDADHGVVRFCTSWATSAENVSRLIADVQAL